MQKSRKRNNYTKLAGFLYSALLLSTLSGCGTSSESSTPTSSSEILKIDSVSLDESSLKLDYLNTETVSFSTGKINVCYSDGTSDVISITDSMAGDREITTEAGTHEITFSFVVNDSNYQLKTTYYVYETQAEVDLGSLIRSLKPINKLSLDDTDTVISIVTSYNKLTSDEKTFFQEKVTNRYNKLHHSELYLIDIYFASKKAELLDFFSGINKGVYSDANLVRLNGYYNAFVNGTYSSLLDVKVAFDTAKTKMTNTSKKVMSIADYISATTAALKSVLVVDMYSIEDGNAVTEKIDYYDNVQISSTLDPLFTNLSSLGNEAEIDACYKEIFLKEQELFTKAFVSDSVASINALYQAAKAMAQDKLDTWVDEAITLEGIFNNINTDYLNDNRWWTPDPYKMSKILSSSEKEMSSMITISGATEKYSALAFEIVRSTLQRNLEMIYTINRNTNGGYDTSDVFYWNYVADSWGDTADRSFTYYGPLSEYLNVVYGNSGSNPYRLSSGLYNTSVDTISALISRYNQILTSIAPDPLAIKKSYISKMPDKVSYQKNDSLTVEGGTIKIEYNDATKVEIPMELSMTNVGNLDLTTSGNKTVVVSLKDPKLNQDLVFKFDITVLSGSTEIDDIVASINELDSNFNGSSEDIQKIVLINSSIDDLGDKQSFINDYSSTYEILKDYEKSLVPAYVKQEFTSKVNQFEKMNLNVYNQSGVEALKSFYEGASQGLNKKDTFKEVDEACAAFDSLVNGLTKNETLDLAAYKTNTLKSLDDLLTVSLYQYSGSHYNLTCELVSTSLKNEDSIKTIYEGLVASINSATSKEEIDSLYSQNIDSIYQTVIETYAVSANANLKQTMFDIRSTVSDIWAADGDICQVTGEANSKFTTDYTSDEGYYVWYIPVSYQSGNVYSKIGIDSSNASTISDIKRIYSSAFFDISRITLFRNLFTVYFYNLSKGYAMKGGMWDTLFFCDVDIIYDGCIDEYTGITYKSYGYRLWRWGWHSTSKATTIEDLLYHYNYDLALFMNVQFGD